MGALGTASRIQHLQELTDFPSDLRLVSSHLTSSRQKVVSFARQFIEGPMGDLSLPICIKHFREMVDC